MLRIQLNKESFKELVKIISITEHNEISIEYYDYDDAIRISDSEYLNLYIVSQGINILNLKRIELNNKRQGTGTKIINWLIQYSIDNEYTAFKVESVLSDEMKNLCMKLNLSHMRWTGLQGKLETGGDYVYIINQDEFSRYFSL